MAAPNPHLVIPAQTEFEALQLDSRLRGNDEVCNYWVMRLAPTP